jgi:hypothetical protein
MPTKCNPELFAFAGITGGGVEMRPAVAPDETVPLEHGDDRV